MLGSQGIILQSTVWNFLLCYYFHHDTQKLFLSLWQAQDMIDQKYPHFKNVRMLKPDDLARAVMYAVTQPSYVAVQEILVQPTDLQLQ